MARSTQQSSVVPSFRAISGRLKFTVRRHKFIEGALCVCAHPDADGYRNSGEAKADAFGFWVPSFGVWFQEAGFKVEDLRLRFSV